ncbi:BTAD domain-containing putative transcriptional regulator [Actinocatenispora sera]|uniref:BTAD domain-containing putative transcriptional regulator n=1 Tax=Actinocatenispora sera TaxID=390989 RepID=UPI0033F029D2
MISLGVLGPCTAEVDGRPVPLGGQRQRAVLALLVAARGEVLPVDRMIEDLWSGEPPARAVASLQSYVSNLRKLLEPGRAPRTPARLLVSAAPGYALRLPVEAVDAWRFERLVRDARARAADQPIAARALLDEAVALWRGPAFAEFVDEAWTRTSVQGLGDLRHTARELRVSCALRAGDPAAAIAEAEVLTAEAPLREEGWRLLALALWGGGRQADALDTVRRARSMLAEELGLDPGPALAEVESAILTQRVELVRATTPAEPVAPPPGEPRPADQAVFVGRDAELAELTRAADAAGRGSGRVALVTGEPGVGKSELLAQLTRALAQAGWLVVAGRCVADEAAPPAWPWGEALTQLARVEPVPAAASAALAPLLAADPDASPPGTPETVGEPYDRPPRAHRRSPDGLSGRFRLHRAVVDWLAAAARRRPIAVLLDDLHWADDETVRLLTVAAAGLADARILLVGALRPQDADGRLTEALAELARRSPRRVMLAGLPEPAVATIVEAGCRFPVTPATVAALTERTGGNPFYVQESVRLLNSEGALVAVSEVPEGVRDVLRRRLARLPEAAVSVLRLAAVAGREAEVEVLVEAADTDEAGVLDALEAGLIAGMLDEPAPGRVRFVHSLVRDTMLADLSGLRARHMHARLAAAIERVTPGDLPALAHHYAGAAASATAAKAVDYCVRAAEQSERGYAYDTACTLLTSALANLERLSDSDRRADERSALYGRLLRAQLRAGAVGAARATRRRATEHAEAAGREDLVVAAFTAWTEPTPWQTRPYATSDEPVIALLTRLLHRPGPDLSPAVRSRLLDAYAVERADNGNPDARAAAERAVALAEECGDDGLRAQTLATLSRELDADLEWPRKAALGAELVRLGETRDLPSYQCFGRIVQARAAAAADDPDTALRLVGENLELARMYRLPELIDVSEIALAMFASVRGDVDDATRRYAAAGERMVRQGSPHGAIYQHVAEALMRLDQGRVAELAAAVERLHAGSGLLGDLHAFALASSGRIEEARHVPGRGDPIRRDCFFTLFATFRALAAIALDDRVAGAAMYGMLLPYRATPLGGVSSLSLATRPVSQTLGELARFLGDDQAAVAHLAAAAATARRWQAPHRAAALPAS